MKGEQAEEWAKLCAQAAIEENSVAQHTLHCQHLGINMGRQRTEDTELLQALRSLLARINNLIISEPDNKAAYDCERGIREKIMEIESSDDGNGRAAAGLKGGWR